MTVFAILVNVYTRRKFFSNLAHDPFFLFFLVAEPQPLMDLCRRTIRKSIGKEHLTKGNVDKLPIPVPMKKYLLYQQGW